MFTAPSHSERVGAPVSSVSELLGQIRHLVESSIPLGWVAGEVSNLVRAASGHLYFTLKDERAQIRCAMWRNRAQLLPFQLAEGMHVEVRAQGTVYEARGDLQLSVENVRRAGQGSLYEAFLKLKARLESEGLFDAARKRPIPALPRAVGIVTSPAAAALRDVLASLARRASHLPVIVYPTPVQGETAGEQIAAAIRVAGVRAKQDGIDLLLVCRGGGSIEDLWSFNHEAVARAIAESPIPVISGVGHETDTTIADFAADLRAATPTAAAEIATAGWLVLRERLPRLASDLRRAGQRRLREASQRIDELQRRLAHPRTRLARSAERLSAMQVRLQQARDHCLRTRRVRVESLAALLAARAPRIEPLRVQLAASERGLMRGMAWQLAGARQRLDGLAARLTALDPDAVLSRGYAIVRTEDGGIVRDAATVPHGAKLDIQLAASHLHAKVVDKKD